ncbi:MAG: VWA domain-containing protein, partial [Pseudomonadota bacterium]
PADMLAKLAAGRAPRRAAAAAGSGAGKTGNRRGRPLPSRAGRLDGVSRIDLIATLRAAAPWQRVRRALAAGADDAERLLVRRGDIRTRRYRERSDRLLIFVVDASGSAAMARLAEAKGAVELLLGEAYARRDHVALVAFRGQGGDLLLPPTRSLVQTKRRLAALPGGGGTPLAAGLKTAMEVAVQASSRGMTPSLALLTDGRANIALDGRADRKQAAEDAQGLARAVRATATPALVIDVGARPQTPLRALADEMAAPYLPLPRADATRLSSAVSAALKA